MLVLNGTEFINTTQCRLIIGGHQLGTNAPNIDLRPRLSHALDFYFIKIIAGDDHRIVQLCFLEHFPSLNTEFRHIARVKTNTDQPMALFRKLMCNTNGIAYSIQCVVRVNEKDAIVGHRSRISFKRFEFGIKGHHPTVRMGPANRNPVELSCQYIGSGLTTTDVAST